MWSVDSKFLVPHISSNHPLWEDNALWCKPLWHEMASQLTWTACPGTQLGNSPRCGRRGRIYCYSSPTNIRKLAVAKSVFRCLPKMAQVSTLFQPVSGVPGRCHLRSADRGHLDFPVSDLLHTADVHLLTPAHQTGTHFLPTSETTVFLSQLSNATLRPFTSLSISTRSTFGGSFTNMR